MFHITSQVLVENQSKNVNKSNPIKKSFRKVENLKFPNKKHKTL